MRHRFGSCVLDVDRHELRRDDVVVHVEPQVFAVLRYLVEHNDRVVPREELLDEIWGSRFVTESALTSRIKAARQAVGDDGERQAVIRTIRGHGFRCIAPVERLDSDRRRSTDALPPDADRRLATSAARTSGLVPTARTVMLGRDADLQRLSDVTIDSRLVTVVGPGGVGKTTLAMQLASTIASRYSSPPVWCDWSAVQDARGAAGALSDALGLTGQAGLDARDVLRTGIGQRRMLVVTDNCEHILDEAADLLDELVASCPRLTIVATSRAPLAIPGEVLCVVDPLACADDDVSDAWSPAAELFVERAAAARAGIDVDGRRELIESLCRSLDGLPLALELAAAALRRATLEEVAAGALRHADAAGRRLRGRVDRHQTLSGAVAWSYELLDEPSQQLFIQLSVFAGSFDVDDVSGLLPRLDRNTDQVPDHLADLVDHSMVVADHSGDRIRYRLLETLRHFAHELAGDDALVDLRDAHAAWVRDLAAQLDDELFGTDEVHAVVQFDRHFAELRGAHAHALESGDLDTAIALVVDSEEYALYRLRDETVAWGFATLDDPAIVDHPRRAEVLGCAAQGLAYRGELVEARAMAEQAVAINGEGDLRSGWALRALSNINLYEGRLDEAVRLAGLERDLPGVDLRRAEINAGVIEVLGPAYAGRPGDGEVIARELLARAEERQSPTYLTWAHFVLAECLVDDRTDALDHLAQARDLAISLDAKFIVGVVSVAIGSNQFRLGRIDDALATFVETVTNWRRWGDWTHQWTTLRHVVGLLIEVDHPTEAARLLGAVRNPPTGARPYGSDDELLDQLSEQLASTLGAERFEGLTDDGSEAEPDLVLADVIDAMAAVRQARAAVQAG